MSKNSFYCLVNCIGYTLQKYWILHHFWDSKLIVEKHVSPSQITEKILQF